MIYNKLLVAKHTRSLEHPYYFWTGYFIPIANELRKEKYNKTMFVVRECGPMTPWLESLKNKYPITIKKPGLVLKYYLLGMQNVVFDYWEKSEKFDTEEFKDSISFLKNIYNLSTNKNKNKIGILNRNKPSLFYLNDAEIPLDKTQLPPRSINNIEELNKNISKNYDSELIDTSNTDPESAIKIYSNLNILIGQWGAGLTNMIWMDAGSLIIEISTQRKDPNYTFDKLAKALGHNFIRVYAQESWTGEVNVKLIMDILKKERSL